MESRADYWQNVYTTKGDQEVSWFEEAPGLSLRLIAEASPTGSVVDIGGGASRLVDHLLDRGQGHVAVLDISPAALERSRERIGEDGHVDWIVADVTKWRSERRYDVWHDRAALHFLTDPDDRAAYVEVLKRATGSGGRIIIGTFAMDGPEKCSGLPIQRYDAQSLTQLLGSDFMLLHSMRHDHVTPWGSVQRFHFGVLERV